MNEITELSIEIEELLNNYQQILQQDSKYDFGSRLIFKQKEKKKIKSVLKYLKGERNNE